MRLALLLLALSLQEAPAPKSDFYGDPLPPGVAQRLGTIRFRHYEDVCAAAFQPDGKVLTAVDYGFVHWWDASTGLPVRPPVKREGRSFSGGFSGDAKRFVVGEHKKPDGWIMTVYDSATGKAVRIFPSGEGYIGQPIGVALSADGSWLAYSGVDGQAGAWDVATGAKLATFKGHEGHVMSAAISPDGRFVATAGDDKTIRLWNPKTGEQTGRIDTPHKAYNLAISKDGVRLAAGSAEDRAARVWDVAGLKEIYRVENKEEVNFYPRFAPDDSELIVVMGDVMSFHEPATGKEFRRIAGGGYGSALSPDGRLIATCAGSQVRLWNAKTGETLHAGPPAMGSGMEPWFSPDDSTVKLFGSTIYTWETATGRLISSRVVSKYYLWYAFSPDRRHYATHAGSTRKVTIHESAGEREIASVELDKNTTLNGLGLSNGAKKLAAGDRNPSGIHLFDVATGAKLHTLADRAGGKQLAFSPEGDLLAAEGEGGRINLWDSSSGECKSSFQADKYNVGDLRFSPDGGVLMAAAQAEGIKLWSAATAEPILGVPSDGIMGEPFFAVSRDGRFIAGPIDDREVKVWESATGQEVMHIVPARGYVRFVAFSNAGDRLAVIAGDGVLNLWSLPADERTTATLDELWEDLASKDAKRAFGALGALAARKGKAAPFLRERLIQRPPEGRVRKLVADLDQDDIEAREKAASELHGYDAAPEYRKIIADKACPAVAAGVLRALINNAKPLGKEDTKRLRRMRAVSALGRSRTPESVAVLLEMSEIVTDALVRDEAARWLKK